MAATVGVSRSAISRKAIDASIEHFQRLFGFSYPRDPFFPSLQLLG
jgi:hypothetical protein